MSYHPTAVHRISRCGNLYVRLSAGETTYAAVHNRMRFHLAYKARAESLGRGHFVIIHLGLRMRMRKITPPSALPCKHLSYYEVGIGRVGIIEYGIDVSDCGIFPQSLAGHAANNVLFIIEFCRENSVVGRSKIDYFVPIRSPQLISTPPSVRSTHISLSFSL